MHQLLLVEDDADLPTMLRIGLGLQPDEFRLRTRAEEVTDDDIMWTEKAIIDWRLPGGTGQVVIDRIRELRGDEVYIIIYTAEAEHLDTHDADVVVSKLSGIQGLEAVLGGS